MDRFSAIAERVAEELADPMAGERAGGLYMALEKYVTETARGSGPSGFRCGRRQAMDRFERIARKVTAAKPAAKRLEDAKSMITSGGRGIELGIREVEYLAQGLAQLARSMRRTQQEPEEELVQEGLLMELAEFE